MHPPRVGWNLVIDVDTPALSFLIINGNVTTSTTANVTIRATYLMVADTGYFWIGQRNAPHPASVTATIVSTSSILLLMLRDTDYFRSLSDHQVD